MDHASLPVAQDAATAVKPNLKRFREAKKAIELGLPPPPKQVYKYAFIPKFDIEIKNNKRWWRICRAAYVPHINQLVRQYQPNIEHLVRRFFYSHKRDALQGLLLQTWFAIPKTPQTQLIPGFITLTGLVNGQFDRPFKPHPRDNPPPFPTSEKSHPGTRKADEFINGATGSILSGIY